MSHTTRHSPVNKYVKASHLTASYDMVAIICQATVIVHVKYWVDPVLRGIFLIYEEN